MKSLGEDWFAVGEIYFRKLHLYNMSWESGFPLSKFQMTMCQNSGHIAMYLDGQAGAKPLLQIYTASGKLVSQFIWKDAPSIAFGWSLSEELLAIQKTGFVTVLDLFGKYLRRFSLGPEAEEREVMDAKFFTIDRHTGLAILTGGHHIFLTTSVETVRMRRLAEIPGPAQPLSSWQIITTSRDQGTSSETFRGPWALIGRKRNIFQADFGCVESIDISKLVNSPGSHIRLLSVSPNMHFVAVYLDSGELIISNLRFTEIHSHIELTKCVSSTQSMLMAVNSEKPTYVNHPKEMVWLSTCGVVLRWDKLLALVGSQGDIYETFYPDDLFLSQEIDGLRVITPISHELLQRVPPALESLGRIGASCPATWLISACTSLKTKYERTTEYLMPIRHAKQMIEAIAHCTEAACHAVLDHACQKDLLEAAHMGRIFLSAMFTDADNCSPEGKIYELADHAAKVCQTLRLLNSIAVPWIGIVLTWKQFQELGPQCLLERLLARKHYPLAIELVRIHQNFQWPTSIVQEKEINRTDCTYTRILAHWACNSTAVSSGTALQIADRISVIVDRLCFGKEMACSSVGKANLSHNSSPKILTGLDFAEVANQALLATRETVAEQILEYEPRAWRQVPLFLKLTRYNRALTRAVETGNPELISIVLAALQDQTKLPPADLAMALRRHPLALAIYQETWGQKDILASSSGNTISPTQAALLSLRQENDRPAEAEKAVQMAYNETNLTSRLTALQNAEEIYRQVKQDFLAQECNEVIRLLRFQSKLEKQAIRAPVFNLNTNKSSNARTPESEQLIVPVVLSSSVNDKLWVGQPLNTTLARLLASGQCERQAEQMRREFRVPDKRYAYLRLIGMAIRNESWSEMDKIIRSKKPLISIETLIKICVDGNRFDEAIKLIPRLPPERRVRFWIIVGKIEEAIQAALREKSDADLIFIQQRVGKDNKALYDRLSMLRSQIK